MIYCVGDVHIDNRRMFGGELQGGLNGRARDILAALSLSLSWTKGGDYVVLGDLFNTHDPSPALIRATQRALEDEDGKYALPWVIVGNHDMSSDVAGDNACAPLAPVAEVVESHPRVILDHDDDTIAVLVPFKAPVEPAIRDAIKYAQENIPAWEEWGTRLLLGHWGISSEGDPPYLQSARDAISAETLADICFEHDIAGVCAGNWHGRRQFKFPFTREDGEEASVHILQVGALVPTGFDNPGWNGYGTFAWWNSQEMCWVWKEIPGPRFLTHLPSMEELNKYRDCKVYVRPDVASTEEAEEAIAKISSLPVMGHPRIVASSEEKGQKLAAATSARSATTFARALAAYLEKMPLPVGVDRAEVLSLVQAYLAHA